MSVNRSTAGIDAWLEELWDTRGTDLLITSGAPPLIRVDGEMVPVTGGQVFTPATAEWVVKQVVGDDLVSRYERELEIDFAFSWRNRARIRCNAFHQRSTCSMALRMIPFEIPG